MDICDVCGGDLEFVGTEEFETEARESYGYDVYTRCADKYFCYECDEEIQVEYYK